MTCVLDSCIIYGPTMKEQLTKFKTQYDLHANYNRQGLLEAKKEAYQTEIQCSNRIRTSSQQEFTLKPLDVSFVQSLTLKDHPKFVEIQKTFAKYNSQIKTLKENPCDGLHLKKVVMESMLKFLRVMMLAPDLHSKKVILDLSYYWLQKQLNPKTQRKPLNAMLQQIKQIVSEHNVLPRSLLDKELPSSKVERDLKEYRIKARTQHSQLDAPQFELQNYHIHKVTYMSEHSETTDDGDQKRNKRNERVNYPKPNLDQYYILPEEENKEEEKIEITEIQLTPQNLQTAEEAQKTNPEGQKVIEGVPEEGTPENAELAKQMQLLNQMGGEADDPQQGVIEDDEDKKKGKLDPFVKLFLRKQMQEKEASGAFQHPPINQLERYRNNYKQALQREDENFSSKMNEWASKRSRFKSEIARKIQSIRMYQNKTVTLPQEQSDDSVFYQTRINEAIRDGRKYLNGELKREALNTEGSLSCFDRRRAKTLASSTNKPFADIISNNRRAYQKQESLIEIQKIKENFAKKKIFTSMQAMRGGLMHPEERDIDDQLQKLEFPVSLLSNPFFPKKKKKKGKKKKK